MLAEDGPLVARFGDYRLDAIRAADLIAWFDDFLAAGGRRGKKGGLSQKTGRRYLDALNDVLTWALEREIIEENPILGLRAVLRRRNRTQRGRAESAPGAHPIEKPEDVTALVTAAKADGDKVAKATGDKTAKAKGVKNYLATLLLLDAGLRLGEAPALDWEAGQGDRPRRAGRPP